MSITIVGLGPGNPQQLTREAWQVLEHSREVYLRTRHHPTVPALPDHLTLHSFDYLYEEKDDFAAVYETIAEKVIALSQRPQGVVYAVPGHPLVGEASVQRILRAAQERGIPVRIVPGLSFIEPVLTCLGLDALDGLQILDATDLAARYHPLLNPDLPALIGQLYGRHLASQVKLTLMHLYPDDYPVTLVGRAGLADEWTRTLPLYELDRVPEVDHLTTLYIPPLPQPSSLPAFLDTIAHLRAPDGCPWDRQQTHQSLREAMLEECYEVLAALDADDPQALREELGDLLLQIALHTQIAVEGGEFSIADVISSIDAKIKRRHPHVFAGLKVNGVDEVLHNWEAIKQREKEARGEGKRESHNILAGVPRALPALARAQSLQERTARHDYPWPEAGQAKELVESALARLMVLPAGEEREQVYGEVLFHMVSLARSLGIDAESALREAAERFVRRFQGDFIHHADPRA